MADSKEKKTIYVNFKEDLKQFSHQVSQLISDSSLLSQIEFLDKIAFAVNQLYKDSMAISQYKDEETEEIGSIVYNIFVQPLSIKKKKINIIKAAEEYMEKRGADSDFSYIMREYVNHPETTKSFVRELDLLSVEMDVALRKIA
ncbi:MAG: hypothetical protein HYZ47_00160 [Simkania negevensis]|nr:hypothetical protein [Simkania negevensis]